MFNVEIELFIFDGVINKDNPLPFNHGKLNFKGKVIKDDSIDKEEIIPGKISLLYNLDSYSKFYRYEYAARFKNTLIKFINTDDELKITINDYDDCITCKEKKSKTNKKINFHSKKIICCYECLKENCKIYFKERLNSYLRDGCISRECIYKVHLF